MRSFRRLCGWVIFGALAVGGLCADADQNIILDQREYNADELRALDAESFFKVVSVFESRLGYIKVLMSRKDSKNIIYENVRLYARIEFQESVNMLTALLNTELKRVETNRADLPLLLVVLEGLRKMGSNDPVDNLTLIERMRAWARESISDKADWPTIGAALDQTISAMRAKAEVLPSLEEMVASKKSDWFLSRERLLLTEGHLNAFLLGQPEVSAALMNLEYKASLYGGARNKPDVVYLMGLPGTGKDQAAETFADAIFGQVGAHKKHLFRVPLMKDRSDTWQLLGSATGFLGSNSFPPFLRFLVDHADGKYQIDPVKNGEGKVTGYRVIENPEYRGQTLHGYFPPQSAIVFLNEFHNWSRDLKDTIVKQALEKGYFQINNPNGGLTEIYVPVRFIIASNEGIGAITSREANGQRHGKPLDYAQLLKKWEGVHQNKSLLKNFILATNGQRNSAADPNGPGISEELLSRIPDSNILLMRPLAPEDLRSLAEMGLVDIARKLRTANGLLGNLDLHWTKQLVEFIQGYDYVAEENARPILDRIYILVEHTIINAIRGGRLDGHGLPPITLDVRHNPDNTVSLLFETEQGTLAQLIEYTAKDRPREVISDERIDELANVEHELKNNVFGIDPILERLAHSLIALENDMGAGAARPANVVMLTGLSSTGKTETAKQLAKKVNRSNDPLITFDFSQIQTQHDFQVNVLGLKDAGGNPIPSKFMKEYDRANGRLIVAFDELANVRDPDMLKMLYDFFREPVVSTFSDGRERPMGGVTVIITGNAGQELYTQVPSTVPMDVQMRAWASIYKQTNGDRPLQRRILEKYFPGPLLARLSANNIFFVPPHGYKSLRQLAQLKLQQALDRIASTDSRRGWNVTFPNVDEYKRFVDTIINEGFTLRDQGASIDSFVANEFEKPLSSLLLRAKVPSRASVVLKYRTQTDNQIEGKAGFVYYDVHLDQFAEPLELKILRPYVEKPVQPNAVEKIVTAYHEAAHSLVRQVAFKEAFAQVKITIIPGVTMIGDQWIYYAGVASSQQEREISTTRSWVVRNLAVLAGGYLAEQLVTRGDAHATGKSNDVERANKLARAAILQYGLSKAWGIQAIPSGMSEVDYIKTLSEGERKILRQETRKLLDEGEALAESILELNFDSALVPLGTRLAGTGEMNQDELTAFYRDHALVDPDQTGFLAKGLVRARLKLAKLGARRRDMVNFELAPNVPYPARVADITQLAAEEKAAQFAEVPLPDQLPIGVNHAYTQLNSDARPALSCDELLEPAA